MSLSDIPYIIKNWRSEIWATRVMRRHAHERATQAVVRFPKGVTVLPGPLEIEGNVRIEGRK